MAWVSIGSTAAHASPSFSLELPIPGEKETAVFQVSWIKLEKLDEEHAQALKEFRQAAAESGKALPTLVFTEEQSRSPASLSKLREFLGLRKIGHQLVKVPSRVTGAVQNKFGELKGFVGSIPWKVEREDVYLGLVMASYRGATASMVWFSIGGLDPIMAASAATLSTALTLTHNLARGFFDKLFSGSVKDHTQQARRWVRLLREQLYSLFWAEVFKWFASFGDGAPSLLSAKAQLSILGYMLMTGGLNTVFNANRREAYMDDKTTNSRLNFLAFLIMAPLTMMDFVDNGARVLIDLEFYQIKTTTLGVIGSYLALLAGIRLAPAKMAELVRWPDRVWGSIRESWRKYRAKVPHSCSDLMTGE